jgi:hypothetical protein
MTKSQNSGASFADILATEIALRKSTTSESLEVKETLPQLSPSALNIIEEIQVFTDLAKKDLQLATRLTNRTWWNLPKKH